MIKMDKCIACGKNALRVGVKKYEHKLGVQTFAANLPAQVCSSCHEFYMSHETLTAFDQTVARHIAEHGPATGETFRFMRKTVGLPANEVAKLLDTTPETVSRREKGVRDVDLWAWSTLGAIILDELAGKKTTRERLASARSKKLAKTVLLEVKARREKRA